MTAAQRTMLFTLFARLAKACALKTSSERDRLRNEITTELFGEYVSWSHFGDAHVDRMKRRLLAMLNPNDLAIQMADSEDGADAAARKRLLHRIETDARRAGFSDEYMAKVATDFYDRSDWRALPIADLENLRNTIANRARRQPAAKATEPANVTTPPRLFRRTRRVEVVPDRHA